MEFLVGGGPRRETEGRCWSEGGGDAKDCVRSPSSEAISVTREDIPPTEGGRGMPRTYCWFWDCVVSLVSGRSAEFAMVLEGMVIDFARMQSALSYCSSGVTRKELGQAMHRRSVGYQQSMTGEIA